MSEAAPNTSSVVCLPNGPYRVSSLGSLKNSRGEELPIDSPIFLCRCGGSSNKPFCDGTHKTNGFFA